MLREDDHKMLLSRLLQVTEHLNMWGSLFLGGLNQRYSFPEDHLLCIWCQILKQAGAGSFLKEVSCSTTLQLTKVKLKDGEHFKSNLYTKMALLCTSTDIIFKNSMILE